MKKLNTFFFIPLFLHILITSSLFSQSPQGIPYQAVMRNADGSVMASSLVNMTFMIHDGTADGTVVYQESHSLTSNAQGLVSCVIGSGVVSQGNFSNINWGSGAKFLHVMMNGTDLGTQQMLSVPYALYAGGTHVSVSATGDTLTVGGQSVIVPGISAANPTNNIPTSGLGAQVLPGNTTCANEYINVVGCNGQTSLTYDGRTYDLVEIGGQCWFADNLATDQYRNGDPIPTGLDNATWSTTTSGAFAIYNNDPVNDSIYGKLYNWYTTVDSRGFCPTGWHVPSDCEWMYLEGSLGMSVLDQQLLSSQRGTNEGGAMKATTGWNSPNIGATNSSGFNALAGGVRFETGSFEIFGDYGLWWSSTQIQNNVIAWSRELNNYDSLVYRDSYFIQDGFSIRCLKDSEIAPIQGCTDGAACNFMANANQDDGSCLYQNATCDDGNANTINDVINGSCVCAGTATVSGCTNPQACNFNAAANVDNGNCLIQGVACDDGNSNTVNDVINGSCFCLGTAVGNGTFIPGNGVTDIDGNSYTSILINGQEWMQQNLLVSKFRNGDPIPTGLTFEAWNNSGCCNIAACAVYGEDPVNNTLYGKLYNWYAVNDNRGLCPTGWYVPSDADWSSLINFLDTSSEGGDNHLNTAGGKMKSINGWTLPNVGASNASGFTGLPGGWKYNAEYSLQLGETAYWWSSTLSDDGGAWFRVADSKNSFIGRDTSAAVLHGFSIRCIRQSNSVLINGCTDGSACNYSNTANHDDGSCLFQNELCDDANSNTTNDVINSSCVCEGMQTGDSGTGAQLLPGNATCSTQNISVTGCDGQTSLTYDGRTYDLVEIGGQCWFADNLATDQYRNGDQIATSLSNSQWQSTSVGAYSVYNNFSGNDAIYGKLYNWYSIVDSRGLCPFGWHIPSDCDWMYLEGSLGMSTFHQEEATNWRGNYEGGALKATTNWVEPNSGVSNESSFTALPGGYRDSNGSYYGTGNFGFWWTNEQINSRMSWYRMLLNYYSSVGRNYASKQNGFSVRCVRD